MQVVVYIDLLFLINSVMNFVVLLLMKWLMKETASYVRICVASIFGGFGGCLAMVFSKLPALFSFLFLYVLISAGMIVLAFGYQHIRKLLIQIVELYCVAFLLSGFLNFLYQRMKIEDYLKKMTSGTIFSGITILDLVGGIGIAIILYPVFSFIMSKIRGSMTVLEEIQILFEGRKITGVGLVDTGNMLTDPVTNSPVLVAEYTWIKDILSEEENKSIQRFLRLMEPEYEGENSSSLKVRFIPFHSVGNERGLLPAIKVEQVLIGAKPKQKESKQVLVGIYQGSLSSQHNYQVILHKDFI